MSQIPSDYSINSSVFASASQVNFPATRQAKSNTGQLPFDESDTDVFKQSIRDALKDNEEAPSEPSSSLTSSAEYADEVLKKVRSGASIIDAMETSKEDLFKFLFEEELEKGRDAKSAVEMAKARLGMDITDQELVGIVEDLVRDYAKTDPSLAKELESVVNELQEQIKSELSAKKQGSEKSGDLTPSFAASSKAAEGQTKNASANIYHSKYLENQRVVDRYESKKESFDSFA